MTIVTGTAEALATLDLLVDSTYAFSGSVDALGNWAIPITLFEGEDEIVATATNAYGTSNPDSVVVSVVFLPPGPGPSGGDAGGPSGSDGGDAGGSASGYSNKGDGTCGCC